MKQIFTELYPILRDLTRSHREGDWLLHLSALERALPLFLCYNTTNYARWGSLYYEDCLKLPTKFPEVYEEFKRGSFTVKFKKTCASAVPMRKRIHVELEDMYEIAQQAKYNFFGVDEMYRLCNG